MATLDQVRQDIEALHEFFVQWCSGALPNDADIVERELAARLGDDMVFIPPAGKRLRGSDLVAHIAEAHGTNPEFLIEIRNVQIAHRLGDAVVATYEEWQRNALRSTPPDNGRISSVIMVPDEAAPLGLRWLHVHETSL